MEYRIDKLRPGARYAFQIRSLNEDETSEWSPAFYVTMPTDTSIPANVTGLVGSYVNKSFKFTWSAVTTNSNASPAYDIKEYVVDVNDGTNSFSVTTQDTEYVVTSDEFLSRLGNGDTVNVSVKAVDLSGNESATPATASASAPDPTNVSSFTASGSIGAIQLRWNHVQNVAILEYEIYMGTTSGFTPDTSTFTNRIAVTGSDHYVWTSGGGAAETKYFKIRAKSIHGEYSTTPDSGFTLANSSTVDPLAGGTPSVIEQTFTYQDTLAVYTGDKRWYINGTGTIDFVRASVNTAPTGSSIIVDVNKNGTTIFTTQANRPTIAASGFTSGLVTNMNITSVAAGDYITIDIDQVGSSTAGEDLTVQIRITET